ncbi:MAG: UPF0158 family protein [Thermoanaerobaculia bacterium]
MPVQIDWEGLIVGFESRSHKITHFFDRETGEVEQVLERDAERHVAMAGNPRFAALPRDRGERTLGDLEEFLSHCEDDACRRRLTAALQAPGSVGLYREALLNYPKEEARFFHFKETQALRRAQEWLAAEGIRFEAPRR